jgi:hypothetical protein
MPKTRVFVSSTSDLTAERKALRDSMPRYLDLYLFEEERARGGSPKDHCQRMIEESHIFLCILGDKFGSSYQFEVGSKSIVEWEIGVARQCKHLELMPFEKQPHSSLDEQQARLLRDIKDFGHGSWVKTFQSVEDLVQNARNSIDAYAHEFVAKAQAAQRKSFQVMRSWQRGAAIAAIGGTGVAAVSYLFNQMSSDWLSAIAIAAVTVVGGAWLLERRGAE